MSNILSLNISKEYILESAKADNNILLGQLILSIEKIEGTCTRFYYTATGLLLVDFITPDNHEQYHSVSIEKILNGLSGMVVAINTSVTTARLDNID